MSCIPHLRVPKVSKRYLVYMNMPKRSCHGKNGRKNWNRWLVRRCNRQYAWMKAHPYLTYFTLALQLGDKLLVAFIPFEAHITMQIAAFRLVESNWLRLNLARDYS